MNKVTPAFVRLAVDLAKQVFQVAGEDAYGRVVYEERIKSRPAFSKLRWSNPVGHSIGSIQASR
jgi:hypothetical protein